MNFLGRHIQAADNSGVEPERDWNNSARDKAETPGTSGSKRVTNGAGLEVYALIAVVVFAFAEVNAFSVAHDAVRRGEAYDLSLPPLWEFTSTVVIDGRNQGSRRYRDAVTSIEALAIHSASVTGDSSAVR
jgi:hypothetical protein